MVRSSTATPTFSVLTTVHPGCSVVVVVGGTVVVDGALLTLIDGEVLCRRLPSEALPVPEIAEVPHAVSTTQNSVPIAPMVGHATTGWADLPAPSPECVGPFRFVGGLRLTGLSLGKAADEILSAAT